jgi:hypothetical protein
MWNRLGVCHLTKCSSNANSWRVIQLGAPWRRRKETLTNKVSRQDVHSVPVQLSGW